MSDEQSLHVVPIITGYDVRSLQSSRVESGTILPLQQHQGGMIATQESNSRVRGLKQEGGILEKTNNEREERAQ
jgi:hypothetical protein